MTRAVEAPAYTAEQRRREEQRRRDTLPGPAWVLVAGLPVWVAYAVGLTVWRHPFATAVVGLVVLVVSLVGWVWAGTLALACAVALVGWRRADRVTFDAVMGRPTVQWRGLTTYRRKWHEAMHVTGLGDDVSGMVPTLLRVSRAGPNVDRIHFRPMFGQTSAMVLDRAGLLAALFGGRAVAVRLGRAGTLWLDVARDATPLRDAVRAIEAPDVVSGTRVAPARAALRPADVPTLAGKSRLAIEPAVRRHAEVGSEEA